MTLLRFAISNFAKNFRNTFLEVLYKLQPINTFALALFVFNLNKIKR